MGEYNAAKSVHIFAASSHRRRWVRMLIAAGRRKHLASKNPRQPLESFDC